MATEPQLVFLRGIAEQLNLDDAYLIQLAMQTGGAAVDELEELTVAEASALLDVLKARRANMRRRGDFDAYNY